MGHKIKPMQDRILVEMLEDSLVTPSGLHLAPAGDVTCVDSIDGDYRRNFIVSKVLAAGPGKYRTNKDGEEYFRPVEVKPGDIVYHTQWNDLDGYLPPNQAMIMEDDIAGKRPR